MNKTVTTKEAARQYREQGLRPIPLYPKSKKPSIRDWPSFQLTNANLSQCFGPEANVGLITGDGLTDVDLDVPQAIELARDFLPDTSWLHGRKSAPSSHFFYVSPGCATRKFADPITGAMLVELRGTGLQTVAPPSIHPSGEVIVQELEGVPTCVASDQLSRQVSRLAAATLIARHYPAEGSRHHATLALIGALIRGKQWCEEEALRFVSAVARVAGDEEWLQREGNVATTIRRRNSGEPATGLPTLGTLMP